MNPQAGGQSQQSNPFIQAMEQMRNKSGGSQPQTPPSGNPLGGQNAQVQANMPPGMPGGDAKGAGQSPVIEDSQMSGQNPGSSNSLIKVLQNLNNVITDSSNPQEIKMVRQIIVMVQELIKMDQASQQNKESALGQSMGQLGQASQVPPQLQGQFPTPSQGGQPSASPSMARGA